jgi:hypothetical protein
VTYRPMDQVEIEIVNPEFLQSGIKTLINALVEGIRDLARDLPNQDPRAVSSPARVSIRHSCTHEDLGSRYTRLTDTLSDVLFIVIHPTRNSRSSSPSDGAKNDRTALTKHHRDVYTRSSAHAQRR